MKRCSLNRKHDMLNQQQHLCNEQLEQPDGLTLLRLLVPSLSYLLRRIDSTATRGSSSPTSMVASSTTTAADLVYTAKFSPPTRPTPSSVSSTINCKDDDEEDGQQDDSDCDITTPKAAGRVAAAVRYFNSVAASSPSDHGAFVNSWKFSLSPTEGNIRDRIRSVAEPPVPPKQPSPPPPTPSEQPSPKLTFRELLAKFESLAGDERAAPNKQPSNPCLINVAFSRLTGLQIFFFCLLLALGVNIVLQVI